MFERLFAKIIRLYQVFLAPWLGGRCRFHPTCSEYAHQALEKYQWHKALWISAGRIFRCHPFHPGGIDLP